jgi:hypothetical protein
MFVLPIFAPAGSFLAERKRQDVFPVHLIVQGMEAIAGF